jgi:hypothetical protein
MNIASLASCHGNLILCADLPKNYRLSKGSRVPQHFILSMLLRDDELVYPVLAIICTACVHIYLSRRILRPAHSFTSKVRK